jgi:hypothetical protein
VPHARTLGCERIDQRGKRHVEQHDDVLRVIDDISELFAKKARIDRMHDRPSARNAVVGLDMAMGIPGERTDAFAWFHTEPRKCLG